MIRECSNNGVRDSLGLCFALFLGLAASTNYASDAAEILYKTHCAECHNGTVAKAPPRSLLAIMAGSSVLRAMESGVMQSYAADLSAQEREVLAAHLTGADLESLSKPEASTANYCEASLAAPGLAASEVPSLWGTTPDNQRHYGAELTSIAAIDIPRLELQWAFAYPEAIRARSQPAVSGDTLFVGSQNGSVFAIDKHSGCIRWVFSTIAEIRTGIVIGEHHPDSGAKPTLLYFGDLVGNVYAVDANTGQLAWRDRPDIHPSLTLTAAPALHDEVLYVPLSSLEVTEAADPGYACCTFQGGVAAYSAITGEKLWVGRTIHTPPVVVGKNALGTDRIAPSGAPVWNTPSIDSKRGLLYVGTGENYSSPANDTSDAIVALRLDTGEIAWHRQMTARDAWNMGCETSARINCPPEDGPDYDFGAATIIAQDAKGRDLLLAGQKSGEVHALNLDANGEIVWQRKLGRGGIQGGVHFGMALNQQTLYVPMSDFDGGARWSGTPMPGMFALDVTSGETLWYAAAKDECRGREFCQPGISAPASSLDGGVLAGAMDGVLRVYDQKTGEVVWRYDTAVDFTSTAGDTASGGSMGGASGPVLSGDMLFVNSGYGIYFHMPGNVLLGFKVKE
ncbi:MAG: PQQ-binding-like beta-propeller repeat protein [Congregibacter sp.]